MVNETAMIAVRDRVVGFRRVRAGDLEPHPQNWRRHPDAQAAAMRGVLDEIGFADVLLVRELAPNRYQLLDGHLRAETVPEMEVPVVVLDLDDAEAQKLLVTYDPLSAMAEQGSRELASLLADLDARGELDLARLVWPDFVINPLLTADWSPAERGMLEGGPAAHGSAALWLTPEERAVVEEAIERVRAEAGEKLAAGACLVRVCRAYLDGAVAAA
jgi:hypothetical protein